MKSVIFVRTPFRLPLGGGSTDLPSYYEKHGGFIFSVAINLYMDIFIKKPRSDDFVHLHYTSYEAEELFLKIKHTIGREALRMTGVEKAVSISFKADTPSGTGLGSSGACSVGLLKGLLFYKNIEIDNLEVAEMAFNLTRNLGLPDGKQDPYVCALGGFLVLEIEKDGIVHVIKPGISENTVNNFLKNTLFFYTGIRRDSKPILSIQGEDKVLILKHKIKEIGREIYSSFLKDDMEAFGSLLDEHWKVKRSMADNMTNEWFDEIYDTAKKAGALGGKIIGAGGGGYFIFYCPSSKTKQSVREKMKVFNLREMDFLVDKKGSRAVKINI